MNHSGDAAEQMVRMSLDGVEVAAKITGSASKEIALLLIAALKNNNKSHLKLKGKARLTSMLKSGKALEIFSVKERDLPKFVQGAKQYGIVYCALKNSKNNPDGLCDIMVKADDAPKISRLVERFKFATVDKAKIESDIVAEKGDKAAPVKTREKPIADAKQGTSEMPAPDIGDNEKLLDELLGTNEGKAKPDVPEPEKRESAKPEPAKPEPAKPEPAKPEPAKPAKEAAKKDPLAKNGRNPADIPTPKTPPSVPTSDSKKNPERVTSDKPSVKEEIRKITAARKRNEQIKRNGRTEAEWPKNAPAATTHKQPLRKDRNKYNKLKGSR